MCKITSFAYGQFFYVKESESSPVKGTPLRHRSIKSNPSAKLKQRHINNRVRRYLVKTSWEVEELDRHSFPIDFSKRIWTLRHYSGIMDNNAPETKSESSVLARIPSDHEPSGMVRSGISFTIPPCRPGSDLWHKICMVHFRLFCT